MLNYQRVFVHFYDKHYKVYKKNVQKTYPIHILDMLLFSIAMFDR
jgi:hypothetical protein